MKFSKTIGAIKKRLENMMKQQRRDYTLSSFTNNPYYDTDPNEASSDHLEEDDRELTVKFDKKMLWNLESKLAGILKRSLELYKNNIIDKKPFEKVKILKFSELLRDSMNELITLGVGIRDKDCQNSSSSVFDQWDDYVETNLAIKIDPTHLIRDQKSTYFTDSAVENLWFAFKITI